MNPTPSFESGGIIPASQDQATTEPEPANSQLPPTNPGHPIATFNIFGQPGTTPLKRTLPTDWPNAPFHRPQRARFLITLLPSDIPLLTLGFLPVVLDTHLPPPRAAGPDGELDRATPLAHALPTRVTAEDTRASDDMWFIYSEGPESRGLLRVNFHRSWTGVKVFELIVDVGREGAHHPEFRRDVLRPDGDPRVMFIAWETHPEYAFLDGMEGTIKDVATKVCKWVLGVTLGPQNEFQVIPPEEGG